MLKQSLQQKLLQKLSPQQIQLMKLLQVPTLELEARIKQELEANPALEEGVEVDPSLDEFEEGREEASEALQEFDFDEYLDDETSDYKLSARNHGADVEDRDIPLGSGASFRELLVEQLAWLDLSDVTRALAEHLIGHLDDDGYLRRDLESIVNDLAFTQGIDIKREALEEALVSVQTLDPAGVGARDLRECLTLQVHRKLQDEEARRGREEALSRASSMLSLHYDAFTKKHYDKLQAALDISEDELKEALEELTRLNPKPGNSGSESSRTIQHVIPDFTLGVDGEDIVLQINGRNAPDLRISRTYREMMDTYSEGGKQDRATREALAFVKQKVDAAKWFVDAIAQRQHTLLKTMQAIVDHQRAYFLSGDEVDLKPMILKDIADRIGMDISTVSRVANSKYIQTPYGTMLLKSFFSEGLSTDSGEDASSHEVKKILKDAMDGEDKRKPLSDEKLGILLNAKGYNIARRTVAKYREQMGIPVARLRKEL
ncbi:MAG: RNA polymerase factor sigma-54 [Bacteroidetes bacterium]|nr:RNA polymerase factor sigma-54 [Bacteroidota bacterium]MDA0904473.1 RNA polymerase factor sigma-54 [Bacteroidota bacterium]MDA1241685.1 RNA polymerase factor sigma-54 [Bacteroidota bacterium]